MQAIAVLGSTGSIGESTLKVVSSLKDRFKIVGLSADSNIKRLSSQVRKFSPRIICVGNARLAHKIKRLVPSPTRILFGQEGLEEIVSRRDIDLVVFAISGISCLPPLVKAIENKKKVALANKESLVSAGSLVISLARDNGVSIMPIDSEHSAIFQCLKGREGELAKIYLTGTGGPLLNVPKKRFDSLPLEFILKHPKWRMGRKISVDSATMMNKGLEIIEATHLFNIDENSIEVLIHPEAIVHSMVELIDGAIIAQLGMPDMRLPIQYALTHPSRFKNALRRVDFSRIKKLSFLKPDLKKFPCLELARAAAKAGGINPAILNSADEEVVKIYLDGKTNFSQIPRVIEKVLSRNRKKKPKPTIADILEADRWAREEVRSICCR